MQYAKEIDGLRAVAVLPVILFHAGFSLFSGGYVGVDVFFVISGYLITGIILDETRAGRFSIVRFYERRARRILPALALVVVACVPFAWWWMLPSQLEGFARSSVAVSLFASNILFWTETDYFSASAELNPLLHTWSLAVEEQYYLLFPPMVALFWRYARSLLVPVLVITFLASLALAQWGALNYPSAAFYLLPTRLWELLLGSLVAFYTRRAGHDGSNNAAAGHWPGLLGLTMISYSILAFDANTPFPSLYALVPTVGTALVILYAGQNTWAYRILANRVFVFIGLISYSAYLWHQPLFAFARLRSVPHPDATLMLALALLALLLAYLSWKYVETPFRNRQRFDRSAVFKFAGAATAGIALIGVIGMAGAGFPQRSTGSGATFAELDLDQWFDPTYGLSGHCDGTLRVDDVCRTHPEPEILVWGDSYAMHIVPGILASEPDARLLQITKSACGPLLGIAPTSARYPESWARDCLAFNQRVMQWLEQTPSIKHVALSSRFDMYVSNDQGFAVFNGEETVHGSIEIAANALRRTVQALEARGISTTVFGPMPGNGTDIGECLAKAFAVGENPNRCDFAPTDMTQPRIKALALLDLVQKDITTIRLDEFLCSETTCRTYMEGMFIYRDKGHLPPATARRIGSTLDFYGQITAATSARGQQPQAAL